MIVDRVLVQDVAVEATLVAFAWGEENLEWRPGDAVVSSQVPSEFDDVAFCD